MSLKGSGSSVFSMSPVTCSYGKVRVSSATCGVVLACSSVMYLEIGAWGQLLVRLRHVFLKPQFGPRCSAASASWRPGCSNLSSLFSTETRRKIGANSLTIVTTMTSSVVGVGPSCPRTPRLSKRDCAKGRALAHARIVLHRHIHANREAHSAS